MLKTCSMVVKSVLRRFAKDTRGNFAMIFGLTIIPMFALAGSAIDFSNGVRMKAKLQASLDATALATARYASEAPRTTTEIESYANSFFVANYNATEFGNPPTITANADDSSVTLTASGTTPTAFIGLVGIHELNVGVDSKVDYANRTVDVALVLDNSGSMGSESRLTNVKSAAKIFAQKLFGTKTTNHPNLQIGIVPFNHVVNVGSGYANASWMDKDAKSPIHGEIFQPTTANRFTLYGQMTRNGNPLSWPGCVEVRPQPYDVYDYQLPAVLDPDESAAGLPTDTKYFVPWFQPDEPDSSDDGSTVHAKWQHSGGFNYRDDFNGASGTYVTSKDRLRSSDTTTQAHLDRWAERQGRVAKYTGSVPSDEGPDDGCYVQAITDLTNDLAPIETKIDAMSAAGNTNIFQGFMWGWRLVSAGEPFTKGRNPAVDHNNMKFVVLLTDGSHVSASDRNNPNDSYYNAFGFAASNRLKLTGTNSSFNRARAMDQRLARGCAHAKADGITVFTITYGSDMEATDATTLATKAVMQGCASDPNYYYHAPSSAEAEKVFGSIAATISQLYLSK